MLYQELIKLENMIYYKCILMSFVISNVVGCHSLFSQTNASKNYSYSNSVISNISIDELNQLRNKLPKVYGTDFAFDKNELTYAFPNKNASLNQEILRITKSLKTWEDIIINSQKSLEVYYIGFVHYRLVPEVESLIIIINENNINGSIDVMFCINLVGGEVKSIIEFAANFISSTSYTSQTTKSDWYSAHYSFSSYFSFMCGLDTPIEVNYKFYIDSDGFITITED